mmetsp:Transcript_13233/g.26879  ORF Transcript_13233/g.26879 Transcript_13233/m.26879 type:complete len:298 (-) Transcript_13233:1740-2633(-)
MVGSQSAKLSFREGFRALCSEDWDTSMKRQPSMRERVLLALLPHSRISRGKQFIVSNQQAMNNLATVLEKPLAYCDPVAPLTLRILRNLCARHEMGQQACWDLKIPVNVARIITKRRRDVDVAATAHEGGSELPTELNDSSIATTLSADLSAVFDTPFFTAAVQFLCNAVLGRRDTADAVWELLFPHGLDGLVMSANEETVAATVALVINCLAEAPERWGRLRLVFTNKDGWLAPVVQRMLEADLLVRLWEANPDPTDRTELLAWSSQECNIGELPQSISRKNLKLISTLAAPSGEQ